MIAVKLTQLCALQLSDHRLPLHDTWENRFIAFVWILLGNSRACHRISRTMNLRTRTGTRELQMTHSDNVIRFWISPACTCLSQTITGQYVCIRHTPTLACALKQHLRHKLLPGLCLIQDSTKQIILVLLFSSIKKKKKSSNMVLCRNHQLRRINGDSH